MAMGSAPYRLRFTITANKQQKPEEAVDLNLLASSQQMNAFAF